MSFRKAKLVALLLGVALAAATTVAVLAYTSAHKAQADQVTINRRVTNIESPTPKQFNRQLFNALKRCAAYQPCKRLFVATAPRGKQGPRGPRGRDGRDGKNGVDAKPVPGAQGRPGRSVRGPQGVPGKPGMDAPATPGIDSRLIDNLDNRVASLERRVSGILDGLCVPALKALLTALRICP